MKVFVRNRRRSGVAPALNLTARGEEHSDVVHHDVRIVDVSEDEAETLKRDRSVEVHPDFQFHPAHQWWNRLPNLPALASVPWASKSQADVMEEIRATQAWNTCMGSGVTIAVVDTGVDGARVDFPTRSPYSVSPSAGLPWTDTVGHGTMCASVACGTDGQGGKYRGVAPEATLLAAHTNHMATDLYEIYDHLLTEFRNGSFPGGLVVSNSYASYCCSSPGMSDDHPYADLIREAIAEGIVFVFAAGNNHATGMCKHPHDEFRPNTIWSVNSLDEVITVGTVDWNGTNQEPGEHANSSRGPGEWTKREQPKPDVVAPTYGEVAWGASHRHMEWWGTSGACPQVAGLAALLLQKDGSLKPADIAEIIRGSARRKTGRPTPDFCRGSGIIDCVEALRRV